MKLAKLLIVPVVVASLVGAAGLASAENSTPLPMPPSSAQIVLPPSCEYVDGAVECSVERSNGVKRISAHMTTGVGQVQVFDQEYEGCPTSVEFSLDPIVLDYPTSFIVESCPPPVGVGQPDNGSFKAPGPHTRPVVIGGLANPR